MNLSDVVCDAVYVGHKEVKLPSSNRGERFYLKFYLVDKVGRQVLAVTADDQGDAHYRYKNAKRFNHYGRLDSNSRKDVIMWLEKIIRLSQQQAGGPSDGASRLKIETPEHPEGVYFVRDSQEHVVLPDSRRSTRWFLTDQYGNSHLAVVGLENQARDGHYIYTSQEPFSSQLPLECRNKTGVYHWLESWIVHGSDEGGSQAAARGPNRLSRGKRPRPVVLDLEHDDAERMTGSPKRQKLCNNEPEENGNEGSFEPLWVREGREQALQEAYRRRSIAVRSLTWLKIEPAEDDLKIVEYWHDILKELLVEWENSKMVLEKKTDGDAPATIEEDKKDKGPHWLRLCLEALKEIGTMYMPLKLMAKTDILRTIVKLKSHPDACISRYSSYIARDWEHMMLSHTRTLMDPIYIQDPVKEFEAKLSTGTPATPPASAPKKPINQLEVKSESVVDKSRAHGACASGTGFVDSSDRKDIEVGSEGSEASEGMVNTTIKVEDGQAHVELSFRSRKRTGQQGKSMDQMQGEVKMTDMLDEEMTGGEDQMSDPDPDPDRMSGLQFMVGGEATPGLDDGLGGEGGNQTTIAAGTDMDTPVLSSPLGTPMEETPDALLDIICSDEGPSVSGDKKRSIEGTKKRPPSIMGGKELPGGAFHGRRASKELPGPKSEADSADESDMSLNLEEIPDEFFEGANGSGNHTPAPDRSEGDD